MDKQAALPLQLLILARSERRRADLLNLVAQQVHATRGLTLIALKRGDLCPHAPELPDNFAQRLTTLYQAAKPIEKVNMGPRLQQ